jgi:hypothetical protein
MLGISRTADELLHSQEELVSMDSVNYLHALNSTASIIQSSVFDRLECVRGSLRSEERVMQY